jgi:hypothetical protein
VLKPGGRLALAAWTAPEDNPWSVLPLRAMVERGAAEPPDPDAPNQFSWADERVVAEHLDAAGFSEHHIEPLDFTIDYSSAEDWWDSQSALSGRFAEAVGRASEEDVAAVRATLERHAERFATDEGSLRIPARTWVAWAAA